MDGDEARLADAILRFVRILRVMGLPLGPGAALDALSAAEIVGSIDRMDFRASLGVSLVKRREDIPLFERAFEAFWSVQSPAPLLKSEESTAVSELAESPPPPEATRRSEAFDDSERASRSRDAEREARLSASETESLRRKDFAHMNADEIARASTLIARLKLAEDELATRRWMRDPHGPRLDVRQTMRNALRGPDTVVLARLRRGYDIDQSLFP